MTIKQILSERFQSAMTKAGIPPECQPLITLSTRQGFGDFQSNGAMGAAKKMGANPRELAQKILDNLAIDDIAEKLDIAGPGFINIHLANGFLNQQLQHGLSAPLTDQPQTIVVDYSGPNLAKEMHVGHLRSTIIGDAQVRILEYLGHQVIRQNHMGDWGTQFGMLIAELEEHLGVGEQPELALQDLEGFYQQAKKHFDADPTFAEKARYYVVKLQSGDTHCLKLWQQFIDVSIAHSEEIYKALNVTLQPCDIKPESAYNDALPDIVQQLEIQNIAKDNQGAKIVFLEELANKKGEPSPVIIQKSDGGYLYATTDLAALRYRHQTLKADRILYFIDARQSLHLQQVFTIAKKAAFVPEQISLEHLAFGTMMGEDGKPFKTRTGGTVKLAALLKEAVNRAEQLIGEKNPQMSVDERKVLAQKIGIGAVKYADLSKTRTNDYIFNWNAMLSFEGNTAPYLQYAYTRIRSIFRKADINCEQFSAPLDISDTREKSLAIKLLQFPETLDQIAQDALPHSLCSYLYDVASLFMSFYEHCPILKEGVTSNQRNSRLQLSKTTAETLSKGLELLGIDVAETM